MIMMQYHLILLKLFETNDMEWNKDDNINNPYAKEILNNDLVLSIEDLNEPWRSICFILSQGS